MRLVISPHLDDAVLGCGNYLAGSRDTVVTVFAGAPPEKMSTPYDDACGFATSGDAMRARLEEDSRALGSLGCRRLLMHWLDKQYGGERPTPDELAEAILKMVPDLDVGILGPLGIQHPDHVLASDACLLLAAYGVPMWLYEELPYRVAWPELAQARLDVVRGRGWTPTPDLIGAAEPGVKERAIANYRSQTLDLHSCLVPERYWRLVPCV